MVFGGVKVDEIPPERTSVVTVLLERELVKDEHTVSCSKAVFGSRFLVMYFGE